MQEIAQAVKEYQLYLGGKFLHAASGKTFVSTNPASGAPLAEVSEADARDVDMAVTAARNAFDRWRKTPGHERGRVLRKVRS
jgi:acyl-CoA reductase-like NAD-dependent aldehyde dehydrogenase